MKNLCEKVILKENLLNNVNYFKSKIGKSKLCAVVKADAYGHGINTVVPLIRGKVDYFAVANYTEAERVRILTNKSILILGEVEKQDIISCINQNISISISNCGMLNLVAKIAKQINKVAHVHFKINTGMNRLGFKDLKNFIKAFNKYKDCKYLKYEGIFTHFYEQNNMDTIDMQKERFLKFINSVSCKNLIKHCASTTISLTRKDCLFDMCRVGIGLYNYALDKYIKPVMQIKAKIINIINLKKGDNVGYENGFVAKSKMKIAVLSIGYADGYLRCFSNNSKVIIKHQFANIVGNVCMDMCFCDVTNINCKIFDDVIILGQYEDLSINAEELAKNGNTISYEILTNFKSDRMNVCVK